MDANTALQESLKFSAEGRFQAADAVLESAVRRGEKEGTPGTVLEVLEAERERLRRIRWDFRRTRPDLLRLLGRGMSGFDEGELDAWIREGVVDRRVLDGEERFFVSSYANVFFRRPDLEARRIPVPDTTALQRGYLREVREIREAARVHGGPFLPPKRLKVRMTVTVSPEAAPAGSEVAAWIPVPRRYRHQDGFRWWRSSPGLASEADLASEESPIRSVYLRQRVEGVLGARFEVEYEYRPGAVSFRLEPGAPGGKGGPPWDGAAGLGEAPHVVFSPEVRALAARLAAGERDPVVRARRFYEWIAERIRYSYAPEYSTIPDLGGRCLREGRGDCGQAAFLFITLCRVSGIPARWQSGWSLHPGAETIHDWCEIRLEPWGWVPVDPYMGMYAMQYTPALDPEERRELRDFYFGGLDAHRLAANRDHQQVLHPRKRSVRSDPVDFQRGEVEVDGRNVYFDRFDYDLVWEELPAEDAVPPPRGNRFPGDSPGRDR